MGHARYTAEETQRLANEWYEGHLRTKLDTAENLRKILVIDVDSGEYEMDTDHLAAIERLREKHPDGMFFSMRIGYPTLGKIGGGWGLHKS